MAGVSRTLLFFLLISASILQNDAKYRASSHSSSRHSYPSSNGRSGHSSSSYGSVHHTSVVKPSYSTHSTSYHPSSNPSHSSYPSGGGYSGSSHSSYPSSGGLSGSNYPSYPSTGGLSGSGSSASKFPSSGSSYPSYPSSGGISGSSGYNSASKYPNSGSSYPSYPSNGGLSGSGSSSSGSSYPSGSGLSGSNSGYSPFSTGIGSSGSKASYPSGSGLSGNGASYPSSGGLSGNSKHAYPTNTGSSYPGHQTKPASYPSSSTGLSGTGNLYPQTTGTMHHNNNKYPSYSSGSSYHPSSNTHTTHHHSHHTNTIHHHHYHYNPPQAVYYTPLHGGVSMSYPVYRGTPPMYVYEYRSSGSRYSDLLAGLALYNLGKMSANSHSHHYHDTYRPMQNEMCKFGVRYDNGNYEEMAIDCRMVTNFIWSEMNTNQAPLTNTVMTNTQTVVTTVNRTDIVVNNQNLLANGTLVSSMNSPLNSNPVGQTLYPNGTLIQTNNSPVGTVAVNGAIVPANSPVVNSVPSNLYPDASSHSEVVLLPNGTLVDTKIPLSSSGTLSNGPVNTQSVSSVTTTTTEVVSAKDPKFRGSPVVLTPGMECYVVRSVPNYNTIRKTVPCGLLQQYSRQSLRRNAGFSLNASVSKILIGLAIIFYFR